MIYCFLANGFEESEALSTVDVIRRAKLELKLVSINETYVTSSHNVTVKADITIDQISDYEDIDAIILPGGMPGTLNLQNSEKLRDIILYCNENNKLICAICAAPMILGNLGLLKNKDATCFPGFEKELKDANVKTDKVVKDGNIITAKGAGVSFLFGYEIVAALLSQEEADDIKSAMQY